MPQSQAAMKISPLPPKYQRFSPRDDRRLRLILGLISAHRDARDNAPSLAFYFYGRPASGQAASGQCLLGQIGTLLGLLELDWLRCSSMALPSSRAPAAGSS